MQSSLRSGCSPDSFGCPGRAKIGWTGEERAMEQIYMYTPAVHDPATYAPDAAKI